jgi:uncharacterized membrane protein
MTSEPDGGGNPITPAIATRSRVVFVDVARALAVLFMILGHSLNVMLAPEFQHNRPFETLLFLRGLTSCTFLLLSGFAFMVASGRYWEAHLRPSLRAFRRLRRFVFFVFLGYAMRFPVDRYADFRFLTPERWEYFLRVDILQCIGVTLVLLQLVILLARTPGRFAAAAVAAGGLVILVTPAAYRLDWTRYLPVGIAAYLSPATGSLFPVLPWSAFMLLGAALGHLYVSAWASNPVAFARRVLLPGGLGLVALGVGLHLLPFAPLGAGDFWLVSPNFFLIRTGCVLLVLAGIAYLTRAMHHLPRIVAALAQESLLIYFIHIIVLYGSAWNVGLVRLLPVPFGPGMAAIGVAGMLVSMSLLAGAWNWVKRRHRRIAAGCRMVVAVGFWLSIR